MYLRFPHPLNFQMELKKYPPPKPQSVLESKVRAGLAVAEGMWEAQADSRAGAPPVQPWGCGSGQPHGAYPPSPVLLLTATGPGLSLCSGQAHGCLLSDGGALSMCPPLPRASGVHGCPPVPVHGPEDLRASEYG